MRPPIFWFLFSLMLFSSLTNGEMCGGWMYERALGKWASRALKQGAHLPPHQSIQLHLHVFKWACHCLYRCHCHHWMVRSPSSASSINPTLSSSSTWFLNIVIKVNILATAGDGWELWKPCLLSKLWTQKPENTKQGSESLHCNALYAMMLPTLPNWTAL